MRCLWLSGDVPYPPHSGRRAYSAGLSDALAGAGVTVVGLGIGEDAIGQAPSRVEWRPVPVAPVPRRLRKLASRWPSMADDRHTRPYRSAVDDVLRERGLDVVVVDHLQMCWTLPLMRTCRGPIVYVAHNHESSSRRAIAKHVPWRNPMKGPLMLDAWWSHRSERNLGAASALVTAITELDASRFRADGARRVLMLTPGYSGSVCSQRTIDDATPRIAVMVSNLDWHVKQANLLRLLEFADPLLADADIELRIVGPSPPDFVGRQAARLRATRFVGPVESIDDELGAARLAVICERDGGGFKLKALDYVFRRVPMVVLHGSMEGLPLVAGIDYLSSSTEEGVAHQIVQLVNDPASCQRLQSTAFDRCRSRFNWSTRGAEFATALDEISSEIERARS